MCSNKRVPISITHPELLGEWDFAKNSDISSENITAGSNKYVWWCCSKCSYGWSTKVYHRTNGAGCPACAGRVVSDRNRLSILYPELCSEWDTEKNARGPEKFSFSSSSKVWWLCKKCGYSWKTYITNRTNKNSPRGCPACAGQVVTDRNRLSIVNPEVSEEWSVSKNGGLSPADVPAGRNKKVWWECSVCSYAWESRIYDRAVRGRGCPSCAGQVVSDANRMSLICPPLVDEWCYRKNEISPEDVSYGSNKKVWWECPVCGYCWRAAVDDRYSGCGCPACAGKVITEHNSLVGNRPDIAVEWHPTRNGADKAVDFFLYSNRRAWWLCGVCRYEWQASVSDRVSGNGCPSCSGRVVSDKNRLSLCCSGLCKEWDYDKNTEYGPEDISKGCDKKVWWVCKTCSYEWEANVKNRVAGRGCPKCACGQVSRVSQKWLDSLGIKHLKREYYISGLGVRADGYDPATNTVYEFLGDFWHGNPEIFPAREMNPKNKQPFGKLYKQTKERLKLIEKAGYKVVYIWENDFEGV